MAVEPDPRLLRYFVAVAEELHYGRAAQRLFISQPALSQQIRKLEADLGLVLFHRDRRGVRLTSAGAELIEPARRSLEASRQVVAQAERLRRQASDAHRATTLVLGYQVQLPAGALTRIVHRHRELHPEVRVDPRQYDFSDTSAGLVEATSDAALLSLPVIHDLHFEALHAEQVVVLVASESPLARRTTVTVDDLVRTGLPWAKPPDTDPVWRDFWTAAARRAELGPRGVVTFEVPRNVDSYVLHVSTGGLLGLTNAGFADAYPLPGIAAVPVSDISDVRFAAARRTDDARPGVRALLATMHDILDETRP